MAKAPETTVAVEATKRTAVTRAKRTETGMAYLHPIGSWIEVPFDDECEAAKDFLVTYGRKQKFADFVYAARAATKKGVEPASPEARFESFMEALQSGGWDERSGAATPSQKAEKLMTTLSADEKRALVAKLMASLED